MAIRVECPNCRAGFGVREDFAGRRGRCPKCQGVVDVPGKPVAAGGSEAAAKSRPAKPAAVDEDSGTGSYSLAGSARAPTRVATRAELAVGVAEAVETTRRTRTPKEILAAFGGGIEPVRTTAAYRLWVGFVAAFMLLLPLVYLAIIGAVGVGVFYHAVNNVTVLQSAHGRNGMKAALAIYVAPIILGGAVVAFMLKPLFARSAKGQDGRALDPEKEPLLFAFVDGICEAVGAPRPRRIEIDCNVNASARLDGGPLGVFRNDLVLTIGLPLAAGLSLRQFAGVLAHEFGHFSQGAGMRVSFLIRWTNMWFARVVYERDSWDESLAKLMGNGGGYGFVIGGLALLAVWLARRVLWVLMYAGHAASGFLSRQMEYDADRYEARMVGGATFARTAWRLRELNLAENGAYSDVFTSWRQNRLPDNLPKLVLANVPQIPRDVLAKYRKEMGQLKTGLFDTHPADRDRIAHAKAEATEGIFTLDGPATDVFRNFDSLARLATFEFYRNHLGPGVTKEQLFPISELVQTQAVEREGYQAFDRFFLHAYHPSQPLPLPRDYRTATTDPVAAKSALVKARGDLEATRDEALAVWTEWKAHFGEAVVAETGLLLLQGGAKLKKGEYGLLAPKADAAEHKLHKAEAAAARQVAALGRFHSAAVRRLTTSLGLLESSSLRARLAEGDALREEARALYLCAAHLGARVLADAPPLARVHLVLNHLLAAYSQGNNERNEPLKNAILRASKLLHDRLEEFRWKVGDMIDYPFEHAEEQISLSRYMLAVVPPKDEIGLLLQAADDSLKRLTATYARALGRLTFAAEEVEQALGLPAIESEPPAEEGEGANAE